MIGLDGATFDLIRPWVEEGRLPNLGRLMREGSWAPMRSTHPPMTFPAWNAFMTGMNPAKHGIFDFTERRPNSYEVQFVNARQRKVKTLWMRLSEAGKRVGVVGVPATWPPEPVNGVMISGFDAPRADATAMHPKGLCEELLREVGPYRITSNIARDIDADRPEAALDAILKTVASKGATAKYLYGREPWDCFMVLFGESDVVGHHFWRYMDPGSPHYEEAPPRVRDAIRAVYEALDTLVGELISMAPEGTTVLVASDHGFGGTGDHVLHVNRYLAGRGLLTFRGPGPRDLWLKLLGLAKVWGMRLLPTALRRKLRYKQRRGVAGRVESALRFGAIDWSRTRAYSEELPYYPPVWINLEGREPEGTVPPGEYETVRDEVIRVLAEWRNPDTGEPVVEWARRREEVYRGDHVGKAADVVANYALDRGYTYLSRPSRQASQGLPVERLDPRAEGVSRFVSNRSGSHREMGILILGGEGVPACGESPPVAILDVTPTVLYLLGMSAAEGMDGRVLEEMLDLSPAADRSVRPGEGAVQEEGFDDSDPGYTEEEEEQIRDRLSQWGYL